VLRSFLGKDAELDEQISRAKFFLCSWGVSAYVFRAQWDDSLARKRCRINLLLRFDKRNVTSFSINKDEFAITLVLKDSDRPIVVWFRSMNELTEAYNEWIAKSGGASRPPSED
jgi:hypothetical protein